MHRLQIRWGVLDVQRVGCGERLGRRLRRAKSWIGLGRGGQGGAHDLLVDNGLLIQEGFKLIINLVVVFTSSQHQPATGQQTLVKPPGQLLNDRFG